MIFRSKEAPHRILGSIFIAAAAASVALALAYAWASSNAVVYYITMRPAHVWFGIVALVMLVGTMGVKGKASLAGLAVWIICLCISEEVLSLGRGMFSRAGDARQEAPTEAQPGEAGTGGALRVATWNMSAAPESIDAALEEIADLDADLVFAQECSLGNLLTLAISRHPAVAQYDMAKRADNAIFSRFPIIAVSEPRMSESEGQLAAVEIIPGVRVTCINVHLPPPALVTQVWPSGGWAAVVRGEREASERAANLKEIVEDYARAGPVILAGDFNLPANYAGLRNATRVLTDSFLAAGRGWGKTVPAAFAVSRVDIIYFSRHFTVRNCRAKGTLFSDHRPVAAEAVFSVPE